MLKAHFTSHEATELAGFKSVSMVDYLCRTGIVWPSIRSTPGRGRTRLYSFGDLVLLRAISGLLEGGLPVRRLKKALEHLQKHHFKALGEETNIARYLITDGRNVLLKDDARSLVDLNTDGQLAFAFLADIHAARTKVIETACKNPRQYLKPLPKSA